MHPALVIEHSSFSNSSRALAILNSSSDISQTLFDRLVPTADPGGAMWVNNEDGPYLEISSCNFTNNAAPSDHGGAIYMKCFNCNIENTRFVSNTNGVNGAAVLVEVPSNTTAEFDNCLFANNTSGFNAAVYAEPSQDGTLIFYECFFVGNIGYQGAAISAWGFRFL